MNDQDLTAMDHIVPYSKTQSDASTKLSHEASDTQRSKSTGNARPAIQKSAPGELHAATTAKANLLPMSLVHTDPTAQSNWFTGLEHSANAANAARTAAGVFNLADDVRSGALNEIGNHPQDVVRDAGIGLVVGAALLLAPEGLAAAAIGGAVVAGAYETVKQGGVANSERDIVSGAKNLGLSVNVEFDRSKFSTEEQKKAKATLEGVGAGVAQATAGMVGVLNGAIAVAGVAGVLMAL
jgi:hypothetical protein